MMDERRPLLADAGHVGQGILMGAANIVPGVSGGTVALIFGIYERLVTAVSHFDLTLLGRLRQRRWAAAAAHIDLRFLGALGSGIFLGTVGLASLMHTLLEHHRQHTLAALFGLILASSLIVVRMIPVQRPRQVAGAAAAGLLAVAVAYWLVGQPFLQAWEGYAYLFFCGALAICAMILPGISGAFILLVLGNYITVTGAIKELAQLQLTAQTLSTLVVFAAGCTIGLIGFSKFLRWLLARYHSMTMAILCGLMLGSLRRIWPFQTDTTPCSPLKEKVFASYWPDPWDRQALLSLAVALLAVMSVLVVDRLARRTKDGPPLEAHDHPTDPERELR